MKINSVRTTCSALLLTLIALVLVSGSAAKESPLERVTTYKQWTKVIQQLPADGTGLEFPSVGG